MSQNEKTGTGDAPVYHAATCPNLQATQTADPIPMAVSSQRVFSIYAGVSAQRPVSMDLFRKLIPNTINGLDILWISSVNF